MPTNDKQNNGAVEFKFKAPPPNFNRLSGESDDDLSMRLEDEFHAFVFAYHDEELPMPETTSEDLSGPEAMAQLTDHYNDPTGVWGAIDRVEALCWAGVPSDVATMSEEDVSMLEFKLKKLKELESGTLQAIPGASNYSNERPCLSTTNYDVRNEIEGRKTAQKEAAKTDGDQAIAALQSLLQGANYGKYYASKISEELAKAWANGEHKPIFKTLLPGEKPPMWQRSKESTMATGVTIQGALDAFEGCYDNLKYFGTVFVSAPDAKQAEQMYDAYDDGLDQYWAFIDNINAGLKQGNVKKYIGSAYKPLFEAHLAVVEAAGKKMFELVGPKLDPSKPHEKPRGKLDMRPRLSYLDKPQTKETLQSWTERTMQKLRDGLAAT